MKTSTAIVLGVVGLSAVGGFLYWQHARSAAAAAAAAAAARQSSTGSGGSSFAGVATTISAAIPLIGSITSLFS